MAGVRQESLEGCKTDKWEIIQYTGKSRYRCKCLFCNTEREIDNYSLKKSGGPKCTCQSGTSAKGRIDLTGKEFGQWKVLEYTGDKKWKCQCSCGVIKNVAGSDLRNGKSTNCGHLTNRNLNDLTGKKFGEWKVLSKGETGKNGETRWLCQCSCGKQGLVSAYALTSGSSKSCGHSTTGFQDLTGQQFGEWTVIRKSTIQTPGGGTNWECKCSCGIIRDIDGYLLKSGKSKSCGHLANSLREQTNLDRYGVKFQGQRGTNRTKEQLEMVSSKENLLGVISKFSNKPKTLELANVIGLDRTCTMIYLHKYNLEDFVDIGVRPVSGYEDALNNIFPGAKRSDRTVLGRHEIDLYFENSRIGLEFNGNYWHSEVKKDRLYHQKKSLDAMRKGVRIIHIFEYEWLDENTRKKLIKFIGSELNIGSNKIIEGKHCKIEEINNTKASQFLNDNSLQNGVNAEVNLGCFFDDELIGVMLFGKPRFNSNYQYELLRLCWKAGYKVTNGNNILFKHFIFKYKPKSIITYCDFSKYDGRIYNKLGFKCIEISDPNYKWIDGENRVFSRYQTMKKDLVAKGLGTSEQTEEEIMHNLGYIRVYDCGSAVFEWKNDKEE